MADNVIANAGSGGSTFRSLSDGADQWPATVPAYVTGGSAGAWTVQYVEAGHALPVQPGTSTTWAATQSGAWNITNITGTISLPTGAATAAKQPALGTAGTASADVITVQGIASMTALKVDGSGVTQPVSGTVTANIGTSGSLALDATLTGGTAKTQIYDGTNVIGTSTHPVQVSLANTAANSTAVKVDGSGVTQPVSGTFWQTTQPVSGTVTANPKPVTSGGLSIERVLSAASTNATSVKTSAGQVYSIYCHNTNASPRYLKLYNKASSPTVGTDTPVMTLPVPGNANGAGFVIDTGGIGIAFGTGIALAITTGVADSDTGAVAANEVVINLLYA